MRWSWSVVVGLCALVGCAPENEVPLAVAGGGGPRAPAPRVRIDVEPGAVTFARAIVGQPTTATVRLRNSGGGTEWVELSIPSPFAVSPPAVTLLPGTEHTVELRLEPVASGLTGAVLSVRAGGQTTEVPVRAEVAPVAPQENPEGTRPAPACSGPDGTARLAWSYVPPTDRMLEFTGTLDAEGNLYATECPRDWDPSEDGPYELRVCDVLAFDRDGHLRYRRELPGTQFVQVGLIAGGRLYGAFDRASPRVSALDAADGRVLWTTPLVPLLGAECHRAWLSAPVLAGTNLVVAVYAFGEHKTCNALIALNTDTGGLAWKADAASRLTQPIVDAQGHLYTATYDWARNRSELFSYTADGMLRWQSPRDGERAPVAVAGGTLVLSSEELADAETGAWRATLAIAGIPRWSPGTELPFGPYPHGNVALSTGGLLALPDGPCPGASCPTAPHRGRFFYGLDAVSGALRWALPVGGLPSAPLLTARDTLLLVDRPITEDCEFRCEGDDSYLESYLHEFSRDGQEQAACKLQGEAPFITPPALHRGRLFLGAWLNWNVSNDATRYLGLHAYELGTPTEPASAGWVTEGGGNGRQGRPQ